MLQRGLAVFVILAACGGSKPAPTPTTPESPRATSPVAHQEGHPVLSGEAAVAIRSLQELDETRPKTLEDAQRAADTLGDAKVVAALPALGAIAKRPPSKAIIGPQIAAIRAIGKIGDPAGAPVLFELLARPAPKHPRMAQTKEEGRPLEEAFGLHLAVTGASINALGELRVAGSAKVLVPLLYTTPELNTQSRRAIVASGPGAVDELRSVLRGEHAEINRLFRERSLDRYCGDKGDTPKDRCQKVAAMDFYAAIVLGDLHDQRAVPDLLAALKRPPLPPYYVDDQPAPMTQHSAIFDALRKLGAAEAAAPLRTLWMKRDADLMTRVGAIGAYPFTARDDAGIDELGKIAADNAADDGLRQEAATAYARLARDPKRIAIVIELAKKYLEASAKKRLEADGKPKREADAADADFAKAKAALDASKTKLLAITRDSNSTTAQIKAATTDAKKVEDGFKQAKKTHRDKTSAFKNLDSASKAYLGYARMFQTHAARIEIAIRCKDDVGCYGASLSLTADDAARNVAPYIKDVTAWSTDEKLGLVEAAVERAMIELGKRGANAEAQTALLLDHAGSDQRLVRQSILFALPKIAKLPCASCVAKLDLAIAAGQGKTTLGDLTIETTILRNYFVWAK
jgi:hypothetical protein